MSRAHACLGSGGCTGCCISCKRSLMCSGYRRSSKPLTTCTRHTNHLPAFTTQEHTGNCQRQALAAGMQCIHHCAASHWAWWSCYCMAHSAVGQVDGRGAPYARCAPHAWQALAQGCPQTSAAPCKHCMHLRLCPPEKDASRQDTHHNRFGKQRFWRQTCSLAMCTAHIYSEG